MTLSNFDKDQFLRDYWQQKPVVLKRAFDEVDWISPDELAGLACEEDVESRIILQSKQAGQADWLVEHGPFPEKRFASLPKKDWTLLVQGVDQWVPEVADILTNFDFLPSWRLDDIMISFAPEGGTVSQHYDFFDVFLIQGEGRRRWQIGEKCSSKSAYLSNTPVRILQNFTPFMEVTLEPGDILYIPSRYAHYGVSELPSLTYSVGFRAPSIRDILDGVTTTALETLTEDLRYEDSPESLAAKRGEIPQQAVASLKAMLMRVMNDERMLSAWLGEYVTERKYPEQQESSDLEGDELARLQAGELLMKHPASRFAYYATGYEQVDLFVDGIRYSASFALADFLANSHELAPHVLIKLCECAENETLVLQLIQAGVLVFEDEYGF